MTESLGSQRNLRRVATFCGNCDCGCPELYFDESAPPERRVVLTDDFGQLVQMSTAQWDVLVADIKAGVVDKVVAGMSEG
jgi:hypothetical protein